MIKNNKLLKATLITIFIAPSLLAQTISEKESSYNSFWSWDGFREKP